MQRIRLILEKLNANANGVKKHPLKIVWFICVKILKPIKNHRINLYIYLFLLLFLLTYYYLLYKLKNKEKTHFNIIVYKYLNKIVFFNLKCESNILKLIYG